MDIEFANDIVAISKIDAVEKILKVICHTTGLGFSAVARVTEDRWVAMAVRDQIHFGLQVGGDLELDTTICNEIRQTRRPVAIDEVATDPEFCNHATPKQYGFQSYISVPIILKSGKFFGTLCAIDPKPARVNTPDTISTFTLFAELIASHLDGQERLEETELALKREHELAKLRDQFVAVLGHDLRNPLGAIGSSVTLLQMTSRAPEDEEILEIIERSTARMDELIANLLDFARGRLGEGVPIRRVHDLGLASSLEHVVDELAALWRDRKIVSHIALEDAVYCDAARLGQMLSNLLANALNHGDRLSPIEVRAVTCNDRFEMSVTNRGATIPPRLIDKMFQPFVRGEAHSSKQGLGLGLYISSEIARAHGGTLGVTSVDGETTFTFRMPVKRVATAAGPLARPQL